MRHGFWLNLLFICVGVVLGSLVTELCAGVDALSFLSYGIDFGMAAPAVLNLQVLTLTFGLTLRLNIAVILFVTLAVVIGNRIFRR